jgi:hypothetical protein
MKLKKFLIPIFIAVLFTSSIDIGFTQRKKYEFEFGTVEYEMTGSQTGKQILYFVDYGRKEAIYRDATIEGIKTKIKEANIEDGYITYFVDLIARRGYKFENPIHRELKKHRGHLWSDEQYRESMGWKRAGTEYVSQKECEIWETRDPAAHMVDWVWKGIVLRNETDIAGEKMSLKAIKIDIQTKPDMKYFVPPQNVNVDSVDASKIFK